MTLAFTLANLAGLVVLAWVALGVDGDSRRRAEQDEARRRVTAAVALVDVEDDRLNVEWLAGDEITEGHPEVYVVAADHNRFTVVFTGAGRRHDIDPEHLRLAAQHAMANSDAVILDARDTRGRPVYLLAQPLYGESAPDHPAGAVIAVGDPTAGAAAHTRLRLALLAGVAALAAASAAVGHLLSARGGRPAVASLTQQEQFLADAAHELRTPIAALRAAVDAARGGRATSCVDLTRMARQTDRLGAVVEALLTRARLAAGVQPVRREPLRLDLLVEDVVAELADTAEAAGAQLTVQAQPSVVEADPTLLRLAVHNLVANALRHGHRPGEPPRVQVSVADTAVTVADSGPGVTSRLLGARFDRYTTQGGTGLGLPIVARVAAEHGGRLAVSNAPQGGAVFSLLLAG